MAAAQPAAPPRPLPPLLAVTHNAYDTHAWEQLLEQANQQPIEQARPLYERFLSIFPLASRYWRQYISHEQSAHNYQQVEALFSRCLLSTLSLPLFQTYLDYVKHVKTGADDYHDALTAAYDFTLQHVHLDLHSHSVWLAYLAFLGTLPTSSPYEETQKLHKQRAAFQRAVLLPSVGVEEVWREWDKFEHSVNKQLAVQMLAEWNARHLQAKQVGKERRRRSKALRLDLLSTPATATTALLHSHQLLLWRNLIHYDMSNPMHLSPTELYATVVFTYRQALCHLSHEPVLQLEYLQYVQSSAQQMSGVGEDVEKRWKESVEVMSYSVLWRQCYCEWLEQQGRVKEIREVYERWLDERNKRKKDAVDREEEGREEVKRRIGRIEVVSGGNIDGEEEKKEDGVPVAAAPDEEEARLQLAEQDEDDEAGARNTTLIYIQFIRFARRCEGTDAARKVFMAARRNKRLTYHAYVFAALLEWQVNKNTELASKIFHSGLDKYDKQQGYIDRYVEWLQLVGDHANMRLVVERVVKEGEEEGRKRRQREEDERLKGRTRKRRGGGGGGGGDRGGGFGGGGRREDKEDMEDMDVYRAPLWLFGRSSGELSEASDVVDTVEESISGAGSGIGSVWWRYVELERWTATELSAVAKVEERREVALGLRSPPIALMIDRYRFLDLCPCSAAMRRTVELLVRPDLVFSSDLHSTVASTTSSLSSAVSIDTARAIARQYPRPTLTTLAPIDPTHPPPDPGFFRHRYPGVTPAILSALLVTAGGAGEGRWIGPVYEVQLLLERLRDTAVDERLRDGVAVDVPQSAAAGVVGMDVGVVAGGGSGQEVKDGTREGKRRREQDGEEERQEKEAIVKPTEAVAEPVKSDLFRQRRQNKIPKQH